MIQCSNDFHVFECIQIELIAFNLAQSMRHMLSKGRCKYKRTYRNLSRGKLKIWKTYLASALLIASAIAIYGTPTTIYATVQYQQFLVYRDTWWAINFLQRTVVIFTQAIFLTFHSCDVKTINRNYDFHELYLNSNTFR